jgi:hypothetical protein
MLLAISISIILFGATLFWIIVFGGRMAKAKDYLARAAEFAQQHEFEMARKQVLAAVRINPKYRTNPDVQALYEIITAKAVGHDARAAIRQIKSALPLLPKTKTEVIFGSSFFRVLVVLVMIFWLIMRLVDLRSRM